MVDDAEQHGRPAGDVRRLLAGHELQRARRLEALLQQQRRAGVQRGSERVGHAADPEERHPGVRAVALDGGTHAAQVLALADHPAVRVQHALGLARGARRVDDQEGVGRVHRALGRGEDICGEGRRRRRPRVELVRPHRATGAEHHDGAQVRRVGEAERAAGVLGQPGQCGLEAGADVGAEQPRHGHQDGGVGVADDLGQLIGLGERAHGDGDGPDATDGEVGDDPLRRLRQQDRHPAALADAEVEQLGGQASRRRRRTRHT